MRKLTLSAKSVAMRVFCAAILVFASFVGILAQAEKPFSINTSPLPAPTSPVMDYAGVIDEGTKQQIEKKIIAFRDKTNPKVELAVAIVKTTGDRPIFDYSLAVARGWGIGAKELDNPSALLFIAIDDRKYFTQISKDLEDELPDGIAGNLQRQYLVPAFKAGNYGKGVSDTIDAFIKRIEERQATEPRATQTPKTTGTAEEGSLLGTLCTIVICLFVIFIILMVIFGSSSRRSAGKSDKDRWRGGGFGGGTGSTVPIIIPWGGSSSSSSSDWGSSSSWGGSSGGGDSWGGFGGGGDFGGGGAGGDW